ncbi:MAG: peptidoglycan-associated lipoprotein Pal [Elusimicrobiota bacterium]|jgi:peptidoglycan-associated lipoprotein
MRTSSIYSWAILALALTLGLSACAPKKTLKSRSASSAAGAEDGSDGTLAGGTPSVDVEEAAIRGKEYAKLRDLLNIYFDYDSYALNESAREVLKTNAEYLQAHPDLEVLAEGHCDERGTSEYNLALGQKRAKEVRDYLLRLGISGSRVGTLSYGKERPLCQQSTEECWAKNRRSETKVRARTASSGSTKNEQQ